MNDWKLLLDLLVKTTILLSGTGMILLAFRRLSATTRHLIWSLALTGMLLLPVLMSFAPRWRLPILPARQTVAPVAAVPVSEENVDLTVPSMPVNSSQLAPQAEIPAVTAVSPSISTFRFNWLQIVLLVWISGAAVVLFRLLLGMMRMRRIVREADFETDFSWTILVKQLASHLEIEGYVSVKVSDEISMPLTCGILNPLILLPADARLWSHEGRRIVLLHELAHIKRRDCLTQMIANLTCAIYWFNPLVWFAARRLRVERELACDDYVLEVGTRATDYASYLVEIARSFNSAAVVTPVAVGMACSQLEQRVRAILDPAINRKIINRKKMAAFISLSFCALLPIASLQATSQDRAKTPASETAIQSEIVSPNPAIEISPELNRKVELLKQHQAKLDELQQKAQNQGLSKAEKVELLDLQQGLSDLQVELKSAIALQTVESPLTLTTPSPNPAPLSLPTLAVEARTVTEVSTEMTVINRAMAIQSGQNQTLTNQDKNTETSVRDLIQLKAAGVTPEFIESMKRAGYPDLSARQLAEMKNLGVTEEFIKQAQSWSSEKLSPRELTQLKVSGLNNEYINNMKAAGYQNLSLRKYSQMRLMGVTPEYAAQLKQAGYDNLSADLLTQFKIHGITPEYIKQIQSEWPGKMTTNDLLQLKIHNVVPNDARAFKAMGFGDVPLQTVVRAKMFGVNEAYLKTLRDAGFDKLTLDQVIRLKMHGVDAEYIQKMKAAGFKNISANQLIDLKIRGLDTILLKN